MSRKNEKGNALLWGAGLLGVGLLAVGSTAKGRQVVISAVEESMDWMQNVIKRVSAHEGTYDSLNLNTDGAGLSFGILQWSQRTGALGELLREMHLAEPSRFASIYGPSYQGLLQLTARGGLEPLEGALLWQPPWSLRFKAAGNEPVFRAVQDRLAANGQYMQAAIAAAQTIGVITERALSLTYDTSVQQGPGFARQLASRVRQALAGKTVAAKDILRTYAELGPAHFRTTTPPAAPHPTRGLEWRQVGPSEWHVFAGKVDLFTNIRGRRLGLVADPHLSDQTVTLPGAKVAVSGEESHE